MKTSLSLIAMLIVLVCSLPADAQEPLESIQNRMKERYKTLQDLKDEGMIGETPDGWVEVVHEEQAKDEAINKIIDDENTDRAELYKIIARRTDTTAEVVGKQNALRIYKKADPDELFKSQDGKWRQKKDVAIEEPESGQ
jgi:uncharacterized protein YdbL (DUF1318 family)